MASVCPVWRRPIQRGGKRHAFWRSFAVISVADIHGTFATLPCPGRFSSNLLYRGSSFRGHLETVDAYVVLLDVSNFKRAVVASLDNGEFQLSGKYCEQEPRRHRLFAVQCRVPRLRRQPRVDVGRHRREFVRGSRGHAGASTLQHFAINGPDDVELLANVIDDFDNCVCRNVADNDRLSRTQREASRECRWQPRTKCVP